MVGAIGGAVNVFMALALGGGFAWWVSRSGSASVTRRWLGIAAGGLLFLLSLWSMFAVDKLQTTAQGVVVSIVVSGLAFVAANKLFDLAPHRWSVFTTVVGAVLALAVFAVLWGNRVIDGPVLRTATATLLGAAAGYLLGTIRPRIVRVVVGATFGVALGTLAASGMRSVILVFELERGIFELWPILPALQYDALAISTVVGGAAGAAFWLLRGRRGPISPKVLWGATAGFAVGSWLLSDLGFGTTSDAYVAAVGMGLGVGMALGSRPIPDEAARVRIEESARAFIFIVPALAFIGATLIVPTIRTIFLSFRDGRGVEFVGWINYREIFASPNIFNVEGWTNIFGSNLFWMGIVLGLVGLVAAIVAGRRSGYRLSVSPGAGGAIAFGVTLLAFAIFASLRGTIFNNLWWVFTVTVVSTAAGLAAAVLADRSKGESVAKSLIFMPMAISFVGAGVIWRFMYLARDVSKPQTGVLNTLWVGLGSLSLSRGLDFWLAVLLSLGLAAVVVRLAWRAWKADERGIASGALATALPLLWFPYALWRGIGGYEVRENGDVVASTIQFAQEAPFNNVWLMVVLIWIQTGFTMVIFSAAIKAVPSDLIEAAQVDGASEAQAFWRVIIPQIAPTIGVAITTLIVLVMKVFDIVKVMTNGNFGTQVIANEMWQRAFTELNFGLGSALAVVLFIAVLPILFMNIRRMQKAAR